MASAFCYDAEDRLVRASNPDAEVRFTRDALGRVTAETCNDRTVLSSYDLAGRRTRRVTPGGAQERWKYDGAGRPVLLEAGGHVLRFGYDEAGRETRRDLPGGVALSQDWDAAGQLELQVLAMARRTPGRHATGRPGGRHRTARPPRPGPICPGPDRCWPAAPIPTGPADAWLASMTFSWVRAGSPWTAGGRSPR